jgi:hypothetical protein
MIFFVGGVMLSPGFLFVTLFDDLIGAGFFKNLVCHFPVEARF